MGRIPIWIGGGLVLALAIAALGPLARAQELPPSEALKIGVVDLAEVIKKYDRYRELEKKLKEEEDALEVEREKQRKNIESLTDQKALLDPSTEAFRKLDEKLAVEYARFQYMKKRVQENLVLRKRQYMLTIIEDVEEVVRSYGAEKGFTFILKADEPELDEERLLVGLRSVLYYRSEIDITQAIIKILNAQNTRRKPGTPSTPGAKRPGSAAKGG